MGDMNTPQPATQRMGQHDYKVFLIHRLSGRTPFWIRRKGFPRGPGGAIGITNTSPWRIPKCNRIDRWMSTLSTRCKLLINMVLSPLIVPGRVPGTLFLQNLVERRSLLFQLVRRDFEQRFVGSAVGWIWGLIHPLVLLLSWVFVFQVCLENEHPTEQQY